MGPTADHGGRDKWQPNLDPPTKILRAKEWNVISSNFKAILDVIREGLAKSPGIDRLFSFTCENRKLR